MKITSPSFRNNEFIDSHFAFADCGGQNNSPELSWSGAPRGTKSFVLICDDPDAPKPMPWVHWIVYNIPGDIFQLHQAESFEAVDALEGANSWGHTQYEGPCPPAGSGPHRYFFKLYALDVDKLHVDEPDKETIEDAMEDHILGKAEIIARYEIK